MGEVSSDKALELIDKENIDEVQRRPVGVREARNFRGRVRKKPRIVPTLKYQKDCYNPKVQKLVKSLIRKKVRSKPCTINNIAYKFNDLHCS